MRTLKLMEEPDLLAEEYRASGSIDDAQAPGNSYGFPTSPATALGLSPSISQREMYLGSVAIIQQESRPLSCLG
jgi:hypothetical protein